MTKSPAFQFYPKDFLTDINVVTMTNQQLGGYIKLLSYMWLSSDLMLEEENFSRLSGLDEHDLQIVKRCFVYVNSEMNDRSTDVKFLTHKRLLEEKQKQEEFRKNASKAGKVSAKQRQKKAKDKQKKEVNGRSTDVQRNVNGNSTLQSPSPTPDISNDLSNDKPLEENPSNSEKVKTSSLKETGAPPPVPGAPSSHGNQAINDTLSLLKQTVGIDDFKNSQEWQRKYARNCLYLAKSLDEKHGKGEFLRRLNILLENDFKRSQLNDIKKLYEEVKGFIEPKVSDSKIGFVS